MRYANKEAPTFPFNSALSIPQRALVRFCQSTLNGIMNLGSDRVRTTSHLWHKREYFGALCQSATVALFWHPYRRNFPGGQANLNRIKNQAAEMIQLWRLMPLSYRGTSLASIDNGVCLSWGSIRLVLLEGRTEILVKIRFYKKTAEKIFRMKSFKKSKKGHIIKSYGEPITKRWKESIHDETWEKRFWMPPSVGVMC